jgi:Type IV secretory system Conjugative DNA transfer
MVAVAGMVGGLCFLLLNADSQRATARTKHRRAARPHAERQARPNPSTIKRRFRLPGGGIPLGQLDGEVIGIPYGVNRGHYAVIAPTLSGKSLHATATLLRWPDAAVVVDPKSELYERTAGTRGDRWTGVSGSRAKH